MFGARGLSCLPLSKVVIGQGSKCTKGHVLCRVWIHLLNWSLDGLYIQYINKDESHRYLR